MGACSSVDGTADQLVEETGWEGTCLDEVDQSKGSAGRTKGEGKRTRTRESEKDSLTERRFH